MCVVMQCPIGFYNLFDLKSTKISMSIERERERDVNFQSYICHVIFGVSFGRE